MKNDLFKASLFVCLFAAFLTDCRNSTSGEHKNDFDSVNEKQSPGNYNGSTSGSTIVDSAYHDSTVEKNNK